MAAVHLSALRGRPLLLLSAELVNGKIFLASRVTGDAAQAHGCCLELETKVAEEYARLPNIFFNARQSPPLTVRSSWFEGFSL